MLRSIIDSAKFTDYGRIGQGCAGPSPRRWRTADDHWRHRYASRQSDNPLGFLSSTGSQIRSGYDNRHHVGDDPRDRPISFQACISERRGRKFPSPALNSRTAISVFSAMNATGRRSGLSRSSPTSAQGRGRSSCILRIVDRTCSAESATCSPSKRDANFVDF